MLVLIQDNFFSEPNMQKFAKIPYIFDVEMQVISASDFDKFADRKDVFAFGGVASFEASKKYGWLSGEYVLKTDYTDWIRIFGDSFLHKEAKTGKLADLPVNEIVFVRPVADSKEFKSGLYHTSDLLKIEDVSVNNINLIYDSNIVRIEAEHRFFVVNSEIVDYSQYMAGSLRNICGDCVPTDALRFVQSLVAKVPEKGYVLDICLTAEGYKVLELNNITASSMYDCNVAAIFCALTGMVTRV